MVEEEGINAFKAVTVHYTDNREIQSERIDIPKFQSEIAIEFGDVFDQVKEIPDYEDEGDNAPYRYLKDWKFLSSTDRTKCLPVPVATCEFREDHILTGWLLPRPNDNLRRHQKDPIYVELGGLQNVVVDRLPPYRGFWVFSQQDDNSYYYYLQQPHTQQMEVYLEQRVTLAAVSALMDRVFDEHPDYGDQTVSSVLEKVPLTTTKKISPEMRLELEKSIFTEFRSSIHLHMIEAVPQLLRTSKFLRSLKKQLKGCKRQDRALIEKWSMAVEARAKQTMWGGPDQHALSARQVDQLFVEVELPPDIEAQLIQADDNYQRTKHPRDDVVDNDDDDGDNSGHDEPRAVFHPLKRPRGFDKEALYSKTRMGKALAFYAKFLEPSPEPPETATWRAVQSKKFCVNLSRAAEFFLHLSAVDLDQAPMELILLAVEAVVNSFESNAEQYSARGEFRKRFFKNAEDDGSKRSAGFFLFVSCGNQCIERLRRHGQEAVGSTEYKVLRRTMDLIASKKLVLFNKHLIRLKERRGIDMKRLVQETQKLCEDHLMFDVLSERAFAASHRIGEIEAADQGHQDSSSSTNVPPTVGVAVDREPLGEQGRN